MLDRMLDILRRSPLLRLEGNRTVQLHNIRPLARTLAGLLEATVDASAEGQTPSAGGCGGRGCGARTGRLLTGMTRKPVAIVFGPENGSHLGRAGVRRGDARRHAKELHAPVLHRDLPSSRTRGS